MTKFLQKKNIFLIEYKYGFLDKKILNIKMYFCNASATICDSWILVYCWFNSYFTFVTKKKKLHLSLICSFRCLLKISWALKVS